MSHVITEPCLNVKDTACTDVCPVDCIYSDEDFPQYFINPEECIDCGLCVDACPVEAIFPAEEVPLKWEHFIARALDYFGPDLSLKEALKDQDSLTSEESRRLIQEAALRREQEKLKQIEEYRRAEEIRQKDPQWIRHEEISSKLRELSPSSLYDYSYLNEQLIESTFVQIIGRSPVEEKIETREGNKSATGFKASLGNLLSLVGLGGLAADITTERSQGGAREVKYVLTAENKLAMILSYFRATDQLGQWEKAAADLSALDKAALLLTGTYELRDYSGNPLLTQEARQKFIESRSFSSASDVDMIDFMKRGACFVGDFGGRKVYVPFFFSGVKTRSRSAMWTYQRFAQDGLERKFENSIFGLRNRDSADLVISPLAMWS